MSLGERLKKVRDNKGLTTRQVAELIKISRGSVSLYENDKTNPTIEVIAKYIEQFKIDANWLITGKDVIKENELTKDEKELLASFRNLSDKEKWKIIGQVEHIAKEHIKE